MKLLDQLVLVSYDLMRASFAARDAGRHDVERECRAAQERINAAIASLAKAQPPAVAS